MLLGRDRRPKYCLSLKKAREHSELLAEFWRKRWLAERITRPGILEAVNKNTLSYPITHGARVRLPEEGEGDLFEQ
jgi:aminoglycoside phosphotransferase